MFSDGRKWTPADVSDNKRGDEVYSSAFPGPNGEMIFRALWGRCHLFDAKGHVTAESAAELATKYADRVGKVLSYPPLPSVNRFDRLVKDARGRVWWADWSSKWGVVEGTSALGDEAKQVNLGPGRGAFFSVFQPIGDGTRLLAADEKGAALIGLEAGRLAALEKVPLAVPGDPPPAWLQNVLRDHQDRLWVMSERDPHGSWSPISRAIDPLGKVVASHPGWLMLEDRHRVLWFAILSEGSWSVVRRDAKGKETTLAMPTLSPLAAMAEAPDGTVWALTASELVRLKADGDQLAIVERYPVAVRRSEGVWCDGNGRIWMVHAATPAVGPPHTDLICFATGHEPRKIDAPFLAPAGAAAKRAYAVDNYDQSTQWDVIVESACWLAATEEQIAEGAPEITLPDGDGDIYPQRWTVRQRGLPPGECSLSCDLRYHALFRDSGRRRIIEPFEPVFGLPTPVIVYVKPRMTPNFPDAATRLHFDSHEHGGFERWQAKKASQD
jgi:hypothetical protein